MKGVAMVGYIVFAVFVVIIAVCAFINWIEDDTYIDTMIDPEDLV